MADWRRITEILCYSRISPPTGANRQAGIQQTLGGAQVSHLDGVAVQRLVEQVGRDFKPNILAQDSAPLRQCRPPTDLAAWLCHIKTINVSYSQQRPGNVETSCPNGTPQSQQSGWLMVYSPVSLEDEPLVESTHDRRPRILQHHLEPVRARWSREPSPPPPSTPARTGPWHRQAIVFAGRTPLHGQATHHWRPQGLVFRMHGWKFKRKN
jgi:hypothetical protein